jgi:hypothetical protein
MWTGTFMLCTAGLLKIKSRNNAEARASPFFVDAGLRLFMILIESQNRQGYRGVPFSDWTGRLISSVAPNMREAAEIIHL